LYETVKGQWEERFESRYGFWRSFGDEAVARYLDCARLTFRTASVVPAPAHLSGTPATPRACRQTGFSYTSTGRWA